MKKFLLIMTLICIAGSLHAQGIRTKDLPPAGAMQTTDKVVIDRNNATMLSNSPLPTGNLGDIITNIGNNIYAAVSKFLISGSPSNQWSALYVVGDAQAYNAQYIPIREGFGGLLARQMGAGPVYKVINDFGHFTCDTIDSEMVPNPTALSQYSSALNTTVLINPNTTNNPAIVFLPDPSDVTWGGSGAPPSTWQPHVSDTQTCVTGGLTWAAIAMDYKIYGQNFTNVGSWTNDTHYTYPTGTTSHTSGDTSSGTITTYGAPIYLWYLMNGSNGGTFTYQLDGGTASATIPTQGNNAFTFPISNAKFSLGAVRIPATGALAAGSHTVKATVTSTTSVANTVTIEGIGTSPNKPFSPKAPMVVLGGQIPQTTTYPASSTAFNSMYKALSQQLVTDGLIVPFADIQNYLNNTTGRWSPPEGNLNTVGNMQVYQAFNAILMPVRNSMDAVDPREFGASCNSLYFANSYVNNSYAVSTTAGSPTISILHYILKPGVATQTGGGDVGKVICLGPGSGGAAPEIPCNYIASVNTGTNKANMGANAATTASNHYGVMGGYPSNPADPSTAQDDTIFIQNAGNAAILNDGKVFMPTNCMVHNLTMPPNITVEGNAPGYFYGNVTQEITDIPQATVLNCGFNGFPNDTQQCVQEVPHTMFKNIMFRAPTFPYTPYGISASCYGFSTDSKSGPGAQILMDHLSFFGCPIDQGQAYGFNRTVGFTATIAPNGDGLTSTMNVLSITTTGFNQADGWATGDFLALNRTITAAGGVLGSSTVTITAVPPTQDGSVGVNPGNYTINKSLTVSTSTAMTAPAFGVSIELRDSKSQHYVGGIAYNGQYTDSTIEGSICTGTFMNTCWRVGPNLLTNVGNGANRWIGGRAEEIAGGLNHVGAAFTCDSCGLTLTGVDIQFNGAFNIRTLGSGSVVQQNGGFMYGGGHCYSADQDKAMIQLGGTNPSVDINGVAGEPADFGSGCTVHGNQYLFSTSTGASGVQASVEGGNYNQPGNKLTGLYNSTNGVPASYKQDTNGWPKIDTTGSITRGGSLSLVTTSVVGAAAYWTALAGVTTNSVSVTMTNLTPVTGTYDCSGGDKTGAFNFALSASTSTSCSLSSTTTVTNGDTVYGKAIQGSQ